MSLHIAYADSFSSFLITKLKSEQLAKVKAIILFGSAARGDASAESDIDIFVDIVSDEKPIEKVVDYALKTFYESIIFTKYWKLLGVENNIRPIVGKLEDWKDLKSSILANGLVLYGKYLATKGLKGAPVVLFYWDPVKSQTRRVLLSKKLYGYSYKGKSYKGLLEQFGATKISTNCILVNLEHAKAFSNVFKQLKITVKQLHLSRL